MIISPVNSFHLADNKPMSPIAQVVPQQASVASSDSSTRVTLGQQGASRSSSLTYAPVETQVVPQNTANNTASATILSFIDTQIRRDIAAGASTAELESRLQAGLDGFLEGYNDAYKQLDASGLLSQEVSAVIQLSYDQVLEGIESLAEELGIRSPIVQAAADPVVAEVSLSVVNSRQSTQETLLSPLDRLMENSSTSEQHKQLALIDSLVDVLLPRTERQSSWTVVADERRYQLDLYTQEGDRVSIKAFSYYSSTSVFAGTNLSASLDQASGLGLSIDGDINSEELAAINALLSQVNELAIEFFGGDLYSAFERASELDVDFQQIAGLSLNLFQSQTVSATSAYQEVEKLAQGDRPSGLAKTEMLTLARAYQQMQELKILTDNMGFEFKMIEQLASFVADFYQHSVDESDRNSANFIDFFTKSLFD